MTIISGKGPRGTHKVKINITYMHVVQYMYVHVLWHKNLIGVIMTVHTCTYTCIYIYTLCPTQQKPNSLVPVDTDQEIKRALLSNLILVSKPL